MWEPSSPSSFFRFLELGVPIVPAESKLPRAPQRRWGLWSFFTVPSPLSALWAWSSKKEEKPLPTPLPIPGCSTLVPLSLRGRSPGTCDSVPAQDSLSPRRFWVGGHRTARRETPSWGTTLPRRLVESGEPEGPEDRGSECQRDRGSGLRG